MRTVRGGYDVGVGDALRWSGGLVWILKWEFGCGNELTIKSSAKIISPIDLQVYNCSKVVPQ